MAERTGFEPATPGVTGRYSNQLNYRSAFPINPPTAATPLGEAHFKDFLSGVKHLEQKKQVFLEVVKNRTAFSLKPTQRITTLNLTTNIIVLLI